MNRKETGRNSKLNDIDRRVLSSYSGVSLETGEKIYSSTDVYSDAYRLGSEIRAIQRCIACKV